MDRDTEGRTVLQDVLNVAYITARRDPCIGWFLDSLANQAEEISLWDHMRVIIVDFHMTTLPRNRLKCELVHTQPKPCVWQGEHRLTSRDYFAMANARNTALCCATNGYIAYVDDLSVLMPGWLARARTAQNEGNIYMGAYKKVLGLTVNNGIAVGWKEIRYGIDSRWPMGNSQSPVPCSGSLLYGCSLSVPVQALLNINGWDEDCDCCGLGGEDSMCGIMLSRQSWRTYYDRQMLTLESEERHHEGPQMVRTIESKPGSPDASHVMLKMVMNGRSKAPNYFGPGGISALRADILAGGEFPVPKIPEHSWYSSRPLSEL